MRKNGYEYLRLTEEHPFEIVNSLAEFYVDDARYAYEHHIQRTA